MINKNLQQYWLALMHTPNVGVKRAQELLNNVGSIEQLFDSPLTVPGIITDLKWLEQPNHHLITIHDNLYPNLLRETSSPPLGLFVDGNPELLSLPQLAIVGSRNPSHTGLDNAFEFAKQIAKAGYIITSGLALGIDTESHKGALAVDAQTIAVLGTGLNMLYPARNKKLARDIVENGGTLISEFPINTPPKAENFPRRNRIISGLSVGTLVIEATIRSGSLITARLAAEHGREVFAIPGSIHNPLARGCHKLIQQGARLVETTQEILDELGPLLGTFNLDPRLRGDDAALDPHDAALDPHDAALDPKDTTTEKHAPPRHSRVGGNLENNKLAKEHKNLLEYIGYEPTPIDLLVERSNLNISDITATLLILELQGYIKSVAGNYIRR